MSDLYFYEIQDRRTGETIANLFHCESLQKAESAVYGAAIHCRFNVYGKIWNVNLWEHVLLGPLEYDKLESH